ncbi:CCHC-type domain-containing protein [Trichonephila clavipes]|uniref:CCHC-type domain-containing protein n=1 Tax=Trichonephila clavipes TaxID=2585209 RepID=A0A8X6RIR2_TRICX|nr:CCHC-type domain-containing protein [Trichonephila clavipes]
MVRLLTVKLPNKSDGWAYFFSSLEKAFATENVSHELKPKVLLCMLGDKVSNVLVNLGEEELKDYKSLKQVVVRERAIEDKLSKLVKTSISVDGKLVHTLVDSGTEITVIKKYIVPRISVEGASTIYLKGIFGPAVKYPLVYVPIGLATGDQVNVVLQQVLCALAEVLVEDVLLPPDVLDMLGGAQKKAQEHIEDSERNITSCRNEVGTLGTKDEEVTAEMDKGSMVAEFSFREEVLCRVSIGLEAC